MSAAFGFNNTAITEACGTSSRSSPSFLGVQQAEEQVYPTHIAAGSAQAGDEAQFDRITATTDDNRDRPGRRLCHKSYDGTSSRDDHGDLTANQIGGKCWQPLVLTLRPSVFDRHVLAPNIADF